MSAVTAIQADPTSTTATPARAVLDDWMRKVNGKASEALLDLYHSTAILIPTFSARLLKNRAEMKEYFERLVSRPGIGVRLHEKTVREQAMSDQLRAISGIYCWSLSIDDEPLSFEARFSYFLNLGLTSPILHHHSSQIPRTL